MTATRKARHSPARGPGELKVAVVHGSLEQASHPVVVGHCQGVKPGGAEEALDRLLGGQLARRQALGVYPEQEGSAVLVGCPSGSRGPGALVLGLGSSGEVTASKVARAMTHAVLLRALAAVEDAAGSGSPNGRARPDPQEVGVSAVLVGANPLDGLSVEASLAAIVDGLVSAILMLESQPAISASVRVGTLEIVELYSDRAEAACRALPSIKRLSLQRAPHVTLVPCGRVDERGDGKPGQPGVSYSDKPWSRVDIRGSREGATPSDGYRELEFTSVARRARADRLVQRVEADIVDGLMEQAIREVRPDPQVCNTLYELLLPNELKYDLATIDNLHLLVDASAAGYPWEALVDSRPDTGERPLALRIGLLRQFAEPLAREARFLVRRPTGNQALVIGNPPAGSRDPDLPAACAEARAVANLLQSGDDGDAYVVRSLTWDDGEATAVGLPPADAGPGWTHVVNALFQHEYRIVHIAAHGAFDSEHPARSGVAIGPDRFLTAQVVEQLPVVPELVFLNCCHAGVIAAPGGAQTAGPAVPGHRFAASVARQLMDIGVRAVVAAGWAVEEDAASAFASAFYEHMLTKGRRFGEAVLEARRAARATSDSMTWAAYQCYGDPAFTLAAAGPL
ncbi:MAG: CHAT domain-containing protein [Actinomycetota bacterium]